MHISQIKEALDTEERALTKLRRKSADLCPQAPEECRSDRYRKIFCTGLLWDENGLYTYPVKVVEKFRSLLIWMIEISLGCSHFTERIDTSFGPIESLLTELYEVQIQCLTSVKFSRGQLFQSFRSLQNHFFDELLSSVILFIFNVSGSPPSILYRNILVFT